jgi:hypothetical protein
MDMKTEPEHESGEHTRQLSEDSTSAAPRLIAVPSEPKAAMQSLDLGQSPACSSSTLEAPTQHGISQTAWDEWKAFTDEIFLECTFIDGLFKGLPTTKDDKFATYALAQAHYRDSSRKRDRSRPALYTV